MRPTPDGGPRRRSAVALLGLLVLASLTLMVLDVQGDEDSPLAPVRAAIGSVLGPAETVTAAAVRPFAKLGDALESNRSLRREVATLSARNSELRSRIATTPLDQARLKELDALLGQARRTGYDMVAARVVGLGAAQSFKRTVTLDVGTSAGVRADMTVVNRDGLVGRVVRATRSTATVLLIVDRGSAVGGRLGANLEIGHLKGRGGLGEDAALDLSLVDNSVIPNRGDAVVTWGSDDGVPYVAGIPIGEVRAVRATPRQSSVRAVIEPFVDFTSLDVVAVVVPRGTTGTVPVIRGRAR